MKTVASIIFVAVLFFLLLLFSGCSAAGDGGPETRIMFHYVPPTAAPESSPPVTAEPVLSFYTSDPDLWHYLDVAVQRWKTAAGLPLEMAYEEDMADVEATPAPEEREAERWIGLASPDSPLGDDALCIYTNDCPGLEGYIYLDEDQTGHAYTEDQWDTLYHNVFMHEVGHWISGMGRGNPNPYVDEEGTEQRAHVPSPESVMYPYVGHDYSPITEQDLAMVCAFAPCERSEPE